MPRGVLLPGEPAVSALTVRNRGARTRTVWVGLSVRDPGGGWHDVPSHAGALPAGTSIRAPQTWDVPSIAALDTARWLGGAHRLGRGEVRPEHVLAANGRLRLRLPDGRCDPAADRSAEVERVTF